MNQKDYKKIAGMIKSNIDLLRTITLFSDAEKQIIGNMFKSMALDLADYFKKEESIMVFDINKFNRQQFLKMCGLK